MAPTENALKQVGCLKLIGAECSEGIIITDNGQSITWANPAALVMHQVTELAELGATLDEYHARFQVRYVAVLPAASDGHLDVATPQYGWSHPEVLIEIRSPSKTTSPCVFRTRKTVLFDDLGHAGCTVFIIRKTVLPNAAGERFSDLLAAFQEPAAIMRAADGAVVAANAAYLRQPTVDAATLENAYFASNLEINGESFRLVHGGKAAKSSSAPSFDRRDEGSNPGSVLLNTILSFTLDSEMCIIDVSQPWLEWLGYSRNAVLGRKVFELMPASLVERFERQASSQLDHGRQMRDVPSDLMAKDGKIIHALISAAAGPSGPDGQPLLVAICVDVTSNKRLEDSIAATFTIAPVPMLVRECDSGRIVDANEAFLAITGFTAADVVARSFDEFASFETTKRKEDFEAAVQATGCIEPNEVTLKTSADEKLDCVLTATKIWMLGKQCMLLVLQDVSDRRRTELELMSALEAVMNDSSWFSRSVVERLAAMRAPPNRGRRAAALGDLTPRERDVLTLISLGMPDIEIAERLGLTKSTIRNHLSTLYSKIDVKNRGSAIIWARDRCLNVTQLPLRPKKMQSVFGAAKPSSRKMTSFGHGKRVEADAKVAAAP